MEIYLLAEHDELEEFAEKLYQDILTWTAPKTIFTAVYRHDEAEQTSLSHREIEVGLEFSTNKTQKLKEPLNFLNELAKRYKCDFAVGIIEDGKREDVCFFGFEEGRPDMFEISNYIGL